jgi:hypothetical protein
MGSPFVKNAVELKAAFTMTAVERDVAQGA